MKRIYTSVLGLFVMTTILVGFNKIIPNGLNDFKIKSISNNDNKLIENSNTFYLNSSEGNDTNDGLSIATAWKTLARVNNHKLNPGDKLLLKSGDVFEGSLILKNTNGTKKDPILISSFISKNDTIKKRATIDAKHYPTGIKIVDCSNIKISDIIIEANYDSLNNKAVKRFKMKCGVLVSTTTPGTYSEINLSNLLVKDIFYESPGFNRGKDEIRTANGKQRYGWGIRFINNTKGAILKDLTVQDCDIRNTSHTGLKFTSRKNGIQNIKVYDNNVVETGGPGIQMSGVIRAHIKNNYIDHSGNNNDTRKWGRGSGLWTWSCSDIIIENNSFLNANGPGDSAGCHIDFNCNNVIVQYNLSANNAGGFCEVLGNNYNCSYRYNVSINDGYRVKGLNGAFQEGKTIWLSGYVGKAKKRNGPFNTYIYNNTIYVNKDIVSKISIDKAAKGILIANNIFYIEGESKSVKGDQYNPEKTGVSKISEVVFKNNLFLKTTNWPKKVLIQNPNQLLGDPIFKNKKGVKIADFIPTNVSLIKNKGIEIQKIPNDDLGLFNGLKVKHDILGNKIIGKPDLGAIEIE